MVKSTKPIWIDLDNSPHVPFFIPILDRLRNKGYPVILTARDAYNVTDLLRLHAIDCETIGRHFGKRRSMKLIGLGIRATQLSAKALFCRPRIAVSHGSRSQMLAAMMLGIPSVLIADYEHVTHVTKPDFLIVPEVIPQDVARGIASHILRYPGIKEDVYVPSFSPDPSIKSLLQLAGGEVIVTARPPATEAHYHSQASDEVFHATLQWLGKHGDTRIILLPRNLRQREAMKERYGGYVAARKIHILEGAVDGLNLMWHSDLVISGGGTMNREAAALGVPVYSTFRGPIGAVDRYLAASGRLVMLESPDEVPEQVVVVKRIKELSSMMDRPALDAIVGHIINLFDRNV